jgi:hypothetical protein
VTLARSLAARLAASPPRTRALLVAGVGIAALLLALADEPLVAAAGRATLALLAVAGAVVALRTRRLGASPPQLIDVAARTPLSRDAAVALLRVGGRALLVGYGTAGVRLLADLGQVRPGEDRP